MAAIIAARTTMHQRKAYSTRKDRESRTASRERAARAFAAPPRSEMSMTTLSTPPSSSYEEIPYPNDPYPSSHPDHLATVAILSGKTPPSVSSCRVLELGCARGGNLIPIAVALPGASFVGIDSSPRQVHEACDLIERLGLRNIRIEVQDIRELGPELGTFDYIICHGTFSWVAPEVQEKILDVAACSLAPDGIVYVSYNTYPGWHFRGLVREMMSYHVRRSKDPEAIARRSRDILQFLTASAMAIEPVYSNLLKQELDYVSARSDSYLLHDHLEIVNSPTYFHDLVERAGSRRLQFVSEVQSTLIAPESLPPEIATGLRERSADAIDFEQYLDFVINRRFRQSLFCRAGAQRRSGANPDALEHLYLAARNTGNNAASAAQDGPFLKTAMGHLHRIWPLSIPFDSLVEAVRTELGAIADRRGVPEAPEALGLKADLIRCYNQKRLELSTLPPMFVLNLSDKPIASPLARIQAETGNTVTNLRHEAGQLNDLGRAVLSLLDGSHDRAAIVDELVYAVETGRITLKRSDPKVTAGPAGRISALHEAVEETLEDCLKKIARFALLVA
jgi:SAM-dependent methyltransferase